MENILTYNKYITYNAFLGYVASKKNQILPLINRKECLWVQQDSIDAILETTGQYFADSDAMKHFTYIRLLG